MKTLIFCLVLFCSLSLETFAQIASNDSSPIFFDENPNNFEEDHEIMGSTKYNFSPKLNLLTTQQVQNHLAKKVLYPEVMITNGIEGLAVVRVIIAGNGNILDYKIVKSPHQAFDTAIDKAMMKLNKIDTKGNSFKGYYKLHVPINFSIGQ